MIPKGYRPREGDILLIPVVVKYGVDASETDVLVTPVGHYSTISIPIENVTDVRRRKWLAGDAVRMSGDHEIVGTVAAVDGDGVWVRLGAGEFLTCYANDIESAPVETHEVEHPTASLFEDMVPPSKISIK